MCCAEARGRCGEDDPVWYGALAVSWKHSDGKFGTAARRLAGSRRHGRDHARRPERPEHAAEPTAVALVGKAVKVPWTGKDRDALVDDLTYDYTFDPDGKTLDLHGRLRPSRPR